MSYQLTYNGWPKRLRDGAFVDPEGREYKEWIEAGNTPLSATPPPTPPDLSNIDNIEKGLKALALCVAQVGGLTIPQMRTLFKQKWDQLP